MSSSSSRASGSFYSFLWLTLAWHSCEAFSTSRVVPSLLRPMGLPQKEHLATQLLFFSSTPNNNNNNNAAASSSSSSSSSNNADLNYCNANLDTSSSSTSSSMTTTNSITTINGDTTATTTMTQVVLKEFEKKQAELAKRKQTALLQVQKFDSTLQQLERKKQDYLNGLQLPSQPSLHFRETALRSVVKSFVWRMIAGSVTFVTAWQFSQSITTALSIVSSDFFSKAFTMFLGERLMDRSKAGRAQGADNVQRSLTKALVWRLFAICNTLTFAIFFAKDWSVAGKIAGTDAIFKTFLMFAYERVWAKIQWQKEYLIEFSI